MYLGQSITRILCCAAMFLATETWAADYAFLPGKGLEASWVTDEKVGITTGNVTFDEMEQLTFWTSSRAAAQRNDRSLYAVGYQLKTNTAYYSYCPYQRSDAFDARSIVCRYDQQSQHGNGSTASLAAVDYSMASTTTTATEATFRYRHIGGIMRISFAAPQAMSITALTMKTQGAAMATSATMDIMAQTVTPGDYASSLTMQTDDITVAKDEEVVLYVALPAQNLSSTAIDIVVTDGNGTLTTIARVMGPDVKAGFLYDVQIGNGEGEAGSKAGNNGYYDAPEAYAAGIANPLAHIDDILLDPDYTVQVMPLTKKGDVNGDGDVDVLDVVALTGYCSKGNVEGLDPAVCDMNNDGDIDIVDIIAIISKYTKAQR